MTDAPFSVSCPPAEETASGHRYTITVTVELPERNRRQAFQVAHDALSVALNPTKSENRE